MSVAKLAWRQLTPRGRMLLAAIVLLAISLLQPHATLPRRVFDWFMVLDISQSMNVRDMSDQDSAISRLEFSKRAMRQALRNLPCGSRVALGMFTERNTTNITHPLEVCAHFGALDETIARMDWRMAWAADSFIAHGLFSAISQTPKLGKESRLVFMTDGDQAPPANPKYMPEFSGKVGEVKGYIAGTGSLTPSRIPKLDDKDNIESYWELEDVQRFATFGMAEVQSVLEMEGYHGRNAPHGANPEESSGAHYSALKESNLQRMAKVTGLDYTRLTSVRDLANAMNKTKMAAWRPARTDLRAWLAIPAMWLILLFFLPPKVLKKLQTYLPPRRKQ